MEKTLSNHRDTENTEKNKDQFFNSVPSVSLWFIFGCGLGRAVFICVHLRLPCEILLFHRGLSAANSEFKIVWADGPGALSPSFRPQNGRPKAKIAINPLAFSFDIS